MTITSDQSRAARGLLNWTQNELATNARMARATVADFESNTRTPIRNNLISMKDCMYAAGVDFLGEVGTIGVGVRFRERKLQYIRSIKVDAHSETARMPMIYAGRDLTCVVPKEILENHFKITIISEKEFVDACSEMLHHILAVVEKRLGVGFEDDQLVLRREMFDPALMS